MKFFKRTDNYLLHFFPAIWITRVHSFLPIGLALVMLICFVNISIGWNSKEPLPQPEWAIMLMIIPVLIYLVYWFIFQSRYNVQKSGGKMSCFQDYLNFFLYALVFSVAYMLMLVVPFSNDQKLKNAVSYEEVLKDIQHLNEGNAIVNHPGSFEEVGSDKFRVWKNDFIYDYTKDYGDEVDTGTVLTKREVMQRIENYTTAYNKYTRREITDTPHEIMASWLSGDDPFTDEHYYYDYYDSEWVVTNKIENIRYLHEGRGYSIWSESWFWRISSAFICWLALLVWIFKQMNLRHFVFGFISICLTPLLAAIVGSILFGLFYGYSGGDEAAQVAFYLVFIAYVVVGVLFVRGYLQDRLNQTAYVLTMYFHFWIPLLPMFIYGMIMLNRRNDYYYYEYYERQIAGMQEEVFVYWICIAIGLASIAVFKPIYAKFRSLPMQK